MELSLHVGQCIRSLPYGWMELILQVGQYIQSLLYHELDNETHPTGRSMYIITIVWVDGTHDTTDRQCVRSLIYGLMELTLCIGNVQDHSYKYG